jgi:hypothetical protein
MNYLFRNIEHYEYLTILILASLCIVMFIKKSYRFQFDELLNLPTYGKYFILYNKRGKKKNLFNSLFFIFFTINISVYLNIALLSLEYIAQNNATYFLLTFLAINSYFVFKYLIEKLIFNILNINYVFENYYFQKLTCINFISLLFFITNIIFLYIITNPSKFLIYFSISLFFISYIISIIIIVLYNQKKFLNHWFYFILYLCTLEIAPFIIGTVLIKNNFLNNLGV